MRINYKMLNWKNGYEANLGIRGDRTCVVPREVAENQKQFDGKTFKARLKSGQWIRVKLVGSDYDLHGVGTGDMVVRPIAKIRGQKNE